MVNLKEDESRLLESLRERERQRRTGAEVPFADSYFATLGIAPKRGYYILEKFDRWGWWESGVSIRSGWLTEAGMG